MVGHDIRNPLQAMISDVYLLKDELASMPKCPTKEGVNESIISLEKNIGYINKIVADLQDYAKPVNPQCSEMNIYELAKDVLESVNLPDNLTLSVNIGKSLTIISDPMLLRRILTNLITNGIQAMPKGGQLTIVAYDEEKHF